MDIVFYHLTMSPIIKALPRLVAKIHASKQRVLILCKSEEQMAELNDALWTFSTKEFIPHDTIECNQPGSQPVLLSTRLQGRNQNRAEVAVILDDAKINHEDVDHLGFKKLLCMFYGNTDEPEVSVALQKYGTYRSQNQRATLWEQNQDGKWVSQSSGSTVFN